MFLPRRKILSYLGVILKEDFKSRKFYSKCYCISTCKYKNLSLLERSNVLLNVNCKFVRCYSNMFDQVDDKRMRKFFEYLTKMNDHGSTNVEFDKILENRNVVALVKNRKQILSDLANLAELVIEDKHMEELAAEENSIYREKLKNVESDILETISEHILKDPCKDITFEINAGVGGLEAMLFVKDLLNMYEKHFMYLNYEYDIIEQSIADGGGIRQVILAVSGPNALETLKHESGVHRVQRVPATERAGRIHTSVVSVAILPQPSEIEISINKQDLKIETKRASGAGGQHVNTTDSAVRITHLPTGTIVECQTQRSQIQNMKHAMIKLRMKLYQNQLNASISSTSEMRKQQIGMRERNEKIRTYNYNQNRVTDHRIKENGTVFNLKGFMEGGKHLKTFQEKLQLQEQNASLLEVINFANNR